MYYFQGILINVLFLRIDDRDISIPVAFANSVLRHPVPSYHMFQSRTDCFRFLENKRLELSVARTDINRKFISCLFLAWRAGLSRSICENVLYHGIELFTDVNTYRFSFQLIIAIAVRNSMCNPSVCFSHLLHVHAKFSYCKNCCFQFYFLNPIKNALLS